VKRLLDLVLVFICFSCVATSAAIEPQPEYKIKGAYLYNFSKFTRLPETHFGDNNNYDLCIVGENPFGRFLDSLTGRDIQGRRLSLHMLGRNQAMDTCEMVFIARSETARLDRLIQWAADHRILTVSDIDNFAARGGIIGLITKGNRVQFQINQVVAKGCGISISAKLLELGKTVTSKGNSEDFGCSD